MAYRPEYEYKSVSYNIDYDKVHMELAKGWKIESFTGNAKDSNYKYVFYLLKREINGS